jgi:low temperature requirement protein LtrA
VGITRRDSVLLRGDGENDRRVTPVELFFDLVFVFAITQLSRLLLDHLTLHGALQTGLLLLAIGWAWVCTAWATNWLEPSRRPVRAMLIGVTGGSLVMSTALPQAFGDRGLLFAVAFAGMQVGQTAFILVYVRHHPVLYHNFQRILVWFSLAAAFWVAGGIATGSDRERLWVAAVAISYLGPIAAYYTPGLGRASAPDFHFSGKHMAERCQLFLIIAFGESILVTGATFSEMMPSSLTLAAFVVAFLGSVALWLVYFGRSATAAAAVVARWGDPGMQAPSLYTYVHLPMVAGVIVAAVGDELSIAHPLAPATSAAMAAILGGPAIFLAGHGLFMRAVFGIWSASRLAALAGLAAIAVIGRGWSHLLLAAVATLVVTAVSLSDAGIPHGVAEDAVPRTRFYAQRDRSALIERNLRRRMGSRDIARTGPATPNRRRRETRRPGGLPGSGAAGSP